MKFKMKWNNSPSSIIKRKVLRKGGTALFMAKKWHELYSPFVPYETGQLDNNVEYFASGSTGYIKHGSRYAVFNYSPRRPVNFKTTFHPLATSQWDGAARRAGKGTQLKSATESYIKGGGRR